MFRSIIHSNANSVKSKSKPSVLNLPFQKVAALLIAFVTCAKFSDAQTESSNPSVFCSKVDTYSELLGSINIKLGDIIKFGAKGYKQLPSAVREFDSLEINEYVALDSNGNSTSTLIETVKCPLDYEVVVGITASAPQNLTSLLFAETGRLPLSTDWVEAAGAVLQDIAPNKKIERKSTNQLIELSILKAELSIDCPSCMYLRQYLISQCFLSTKANDRCGLLLSATYSFVSAQ